MTTFTTGELVSLKSGSPPLTVDEIRVDGVVITMHWDGSAFVHESFMPGMLEAWVPREAEPSKTDGVRQVEHEGA